jgi:SAM-dependent methyltransferase
MFETLRHAVRFLAYSIRVIGPLRIATGSLRLLADPGVRARVDAFDARFGTETVAGVTPAEARLPRSRRRAATMYLPTRDEDFAAILDALAWSPAELAGATFVDLGSGKGRVVFLAAMRCFREVVGVELSPRLHDIARCNYAVVARAGVLRSPIRFELGDAAELDVPSGPVVLYLYHPFQESVAETVIAQVVASIRRDPRPVAILYGHPTLQRPIRATVFTRDRVFEQTNAGARSTRRSHIGWSIFTNVGWLQQSLELRESVA